MDILIKYFPGLNPQQKEQFSLLYPLYQDWNNKINVVSRKDIDHLYERHVLHSMSIAQLISFQPGARILDVGTGGGFPGIPLAILFPGARFHLVDSIGKKIRVVQDISETLGLKNVRAEQVRAETLKGPYDYIVSRAVTALPDFTRMVRHLIRPKKGPERQTGILYLKGGEFTDELKETGKRYRLYPLSDFFEEPFFDTKYLVHLF